MDRKIISIDCDIKTKSTVIVAQKAVKVEPLTQG